MKVVMLVKTSKKLYNQSNSKQPIWKMKIKKGIPLIDQHDKNGFYGGKFGGNYVAETLKKPIDDLTKLFEKFRKDKNFLKERDDLYEGYVGRPTRFIKLHNLTDHLGGAQIYAKMVSDANGGAHKIYNAITHAMLCKRAKKKIHMYRYWGWL